MQEFLEIDINTYGFSIDSASFYISFDWSGIAIVLTILLAIKLKKFLKGKELFNLKIWGKK